MADDTNTSGDEQPKKKRGPTTVTIVASALVRVIVQKVGDRELHPNGETLLAKDEEGHFIVGPTQALQIVEVDHG